MSGINPTSTIDSFTGSGYVILDLLDEEQHGRLEQLICERLKEIARKELPGRDFDPGPLSGYHLSGISDDVHSRMLAPINRHLLLDDWYQGLFLNELVIPFVENYFGHRDVLIKDLVGGEWVEGACGFRVARPGMPDVSGIHSESSYGVFPITIWVPVIGFDERYTLKLSPGSHAVKHPPEAIRRSGRFMARPYSDEYVQRFSFIRPKMRKGQAIVFHPELIHGGSDNLGETTRVSVEVRIYQAAGADIPGIQIIA